MRPYRALSLRPLSHASLQPLHHQPIPRLALSHLTLQARVSLRNRSSDTLPRESRFTGKENRWHRYEDPAEEIREISYRNPLNYVELNRQEFRRNQYIKKRMLISGIGLAGCLLTLMYIRLTYLNEVPDAQVRDAPNTTTAKGRARDSGKDMLDAPAEAVKEKPGNPDVLLDAEGNELVATGTSSVPYFPKTIRLGTMVPSTGNIGAGQAPGTDEEYALLGLGIRTVTFLGIQVYVLGMYVRTNDLGALQAAFVKHVNPMGSSLIPGEKDELRKQLLDGPASAEVWDKVIQECGVRTVIRIVPVKNTDFGHLRDGFVTGITKRTREAQKAGKGGLYEDEAFGNVVKEFKELFKGRGKAPTGSEVLLIRDQSGVLSVAYGEKEGPRSEGELKGKDLLGKIEDERISRLLWLGYVGGKDVSSEPARKSIVDGVMELVERPVGTVGVAVT